MIPSLEQRITNPSISLPSRTPKPPNYTSSLDHAMHFSPSKEKIHNSNSLLNESMLSSPNRLTLSFWPMLSSCSWNNQSVSWFVPHPQSPPSVHSVQWCHLAVSIQQQKGLAASASFHSGSPQCLFTFMLPNHSYSHFSTQCFLTWDNSLALPAVKHSLYTVNMYYSHCSIKRWIAYRWAERDWAGKPY